MTIRAGVTKTYRRDFVLDSTMLGSIVEKINATVTELNRSATVVFSIYREDDSFYRTKNLDEVLSDDNAAARAIKNLDVHLICGDGTSTKEEDIVLALRFRRFQDDKILLILDSEERQWSFQLAERMDTQIGRILRRLRLPLQHSGLLDWLAIAALAAIVLAVYNWITMSWSDAPAPIDNETLSSLTLEEKLDLFILSMQEQMAKYRAQIIYVWPLAIVFWGVVLVLIAAKPISRFMEKYSRSAFYWGDAIQAYDNARRLESLIFWGIAVGLLVTIVGGLIVTNMG